VGTGFSLYGRAKLGLVAFRRVLRAMENVYVNSETALESMARTRREDYAQKYDEEEQMLNREAQRRNEEAMRKTRCRSLKSWIASAALPGLPKLARTASQVSKRSNSAR